MGYKKKLTFQEYSRSSRYRILAKSKKQESSSSDDDSDRTESNASSSSSSSNSSDTESGTGSGSSRYSSRSRDNDSNHSESESQRQEMAELADFYDADGEEDLYFDAESVLSSEGESATGSNTSSDDDSSSSDDTSPDDDSSTYSSSESSSDEDEEDLMENADEPLYAGAPITVGESIISILKLTARFVVSAALLSYILDLVAMHCPTPNKCATSIYKLKKFFADIDAPSMTRIHYCNTCYSRVQHDICPQCNSDENLSYFLKVPLIPQLTKCYQRAEFSQNLAYRFYRRKENNGNYEDIFDGSIYRNLPHNFSANPNNITFTWNTDGVPIFKSSKFSIWPFYLVINELPYKLRFRKENVLLAGLWFGPQKPCPNLFMCAFMSELEELYQGVDFKIPLSEDLLRVRALTIAGTCDLCAKALFMNIKQYNSIYGCPNCKIRTVAEQRVRVYPITNNLELRTTAETRLFAAQALETNESVYGVKGPSALDLIAYNYVESTAIDEMHIFEGIVKKLLSFWFDPVNRVHGFSLFAFVNIINERIKNMKLPSFIPRIPRKVTDYAYWKASELVIFLLVYSLPVLAGVMTADYLEHHMLLVHAITLLNASSVSEAMINEASNLLVEYVSRFEHLYGLRYMTCNLHLLLHLSDQVRKFGPLWVMTCFPFEDFNGILKGYVHGSRFPQLQICSSVATFLLLAELQDRFLRANSRALNFCKRIDKSGTLRYKTRHLHDSTYAVGAFVKKKFLPEAILNALVNSIGRNENINLLKLHVFHRLLKDGRYYETEFYVKQKKTNSTFIKYVYNNNIHYGILLSFVTLCKCVCTQKCSECNETCKTYAIITRCDVRGAFLSNFTQDYIPNIYQCTKYDDDLRAIDVNAIVQLCFYFKIQDVSYVVVPTYLSEKVIK